jgi:hypothetical protein
VSIVTKKEFAQAYARLRQRDSDSLAAFLMTLALDAGPVGDQVRTFIVGDDLAETVDSVQQRSRGLRVPSEYDHRHSRGREMGLSLDFIVDSIERLVMPIDPKAAFRLLVTLFESGRRSDELRTSRCSSRELRPSAVDAPRI